MAWVLNTKFKYNNKKKKTEIRTFASNKIKYKLKRLQINVNK